MERGMNSPPEAEKKEVRKKEGRSYGLNRPVA
jgi:hypothetical protein